MDADLIEGLRVVLRSINGDVSHFLAWTMRADEPTTLPFVCSHLACPKGRGDEANRFVDKRSQLPMASFEESHGRFRLVVTLMNALRNDNIGRADIAPSML